MKLYFCRLHWLCALWPLARAALSVHRCAPSVREYEDVRRVLSRRPAIARDISAAIRHFSYLPEFASDSSLWNCVSHRPVAAACMDDVLL